jgi:hypothetical protein
MTVVNPPTIVPNSGRPPEDDLDGLLRSFFKAEMPALWPSFAVPAARNGVPPQQRSQTAYRFALWRSRLALAASILLLIAGTLFLFGGSDTHQDAGSPSLHGAPSMGERPQLPKNGPNIIVTPDGARLELRESLDFIPMK